MEPIVTPRAVASGVIIFIGVSLPVLFTHFSRGPEARLSGWAVACLTIGVWCLPALNYIADRIPSNPNAMTLPEARPSTRAPMYELSPTIYT